MENLSKMTLNFLTIRFILFIAFVSFSIGQNESDQTLGSLNSIDSMNGEKYHTSNDGTVYFYVNIWGHVKIPGRIRLVEGVDIVTLISAVGGPQNGANLKKVVLYRDVPDTKNSLMYEINIEQFKNNGDRSTFVKILPNDTILIEETKISYMMNKIGTLNTFMNLANIYLNISNR